MNARQPIDLDDLEIELITVGNARLRTATKLHRICQHTAEWAAAENERHPNRRHEAVPCELAGQKHLVCDGHRRDGVPCLMSPRLYETVCKMHGGNAPRNREVGARRRAAAKAAEQTRAFAAPIEVDPQTALLETLQSKAGQVMYLRRQVNELDQPSLKQVDRSGNFERPSVWVEMLWRAEKDFAELSKALIDVGLAERQARYVDGQALLLVAGLNWMRRELGLEHDPHWEQAERSMLMALASGSAPDARSAEAIEGVTVDG